MLACEAQGCLESGSNEEIHNLSTRVGIWITTAWKELELSTSGSVSNVAGIKSTLHSGKALQFHLVKKMIRDGFYFYTR